jgi:hypothetical protein
MDQSPSWEVHGFSASQEIPRILWNQKVYYRICKSPSVPVLSQPNPVHAPHPTSRWSILILSSHLRLGLPKWSPSLMSLYQNPVSNSTLPHTCHMPHPSLSSRFEYKRVTFNMINSLQFYGVGNVTCCTALVIRPLSPSAYLDSK